jgi:hypothetical protein
MAARLGLKGGKLARTKSGPVLTCLGGRLEWITWETQAISHRAHPQNNGPVVPQNPCQYQGRALAPSDYATIGKSAPWYSLNFALGVHYGWGTGQYMDAQPLTSVPATWAAAAYGNYVYGAYMQAASVPLSVALRGAEGYALTKTYPTGTPMQPGYPGLPAANPKHHKWV